MTDELAERIATLAASRSAPRRHREVPYLEHDYRSTGQPDPGALGGARRRLLWRSLDHWSPSISSMTSTWSARTCSSARPTSSSCSTGSSERTSRTRAGNLCHRRRRHRAAGGEASAEGGAEVDDPPAQQASSRRASRPIGLFCARVPDPRAAPTARGAVARRARAQVDRCQDAERRISEAREDGRCGGGSPCAASDRRGPAGGSRTSGRVGRAP